MDAETLVRVLAGGDEAPAVRVTEDGPAMTRTALRADIWSVAQSFAKAGVQRGHVVSLCFANNVECVVSFLAATWLGAVAAPLNPSYAREEFRYDMDNIGTKFLVVPADGFPRVEEVAEQMGIAVLSVKTGAGSAVAARARCALAPEAALSSAEPGDVALFLHTSGTTGKPKGVPLSHTNLLTTMENVTNTYKLGPSDKSYLVMPLFHVHGLMAALFGSLYSGGEVIIPARNQGFQVECFWRDIAALGATWYTAVPTMHQMLLKNLESYAAAGRPKLRLIRSCSASLPPSVLEELEKQFGAPVLEAYAMTEAAHQMTSNPLPEHGAHKHGSVGKGTNVEVSVLGAGEATCAPGEVGEVCVRGRNVMAGYHNRPDANAEAFTSAGFFRTGDLGYCDAEGYVFLTGRLKEQVNRGGEKIAPVAIDNVLLRCPGVASLFAFGVPHEDLGEAMAVIVVLDKGKHVSLAQLNRFGLDSGELSLQWLPEIIVYADAIPKGPTGKVQRVKLASLLQLPKLTQADAGTSFRFTAAGLERLPPDEVGGEGAADMAAVEALVGGILGLDLAGVGERELTLDSFFATRLSAALRRRFQVAVKPKSLVKGVTLPQILALVETGERVAGEQQYDWEAEATVPAPLAEALAAAPPGATTTKRLKAGPAPLAPTDAVLLTGATGFLGAHLLAALLRGPHRVVCLARGANDAEARSRVEGALRAQGEWSADFDARVHCVAGDVSKPNFGLADIRADAIACVRLIIHNAAAVNHASPYAELKVDNVGSVVHALLLASALQAHSGRSVHVAYVSTAAVCGRRTFPDAPSPPRLPLESLNEANGYVQSKWVAERLVENANELAARSGGPSRFSIYRPGAISGHSATGACNLGDSVNRYVIGFSLLGSAPPLADAGARVDMSPVDWVARATAGLALQDMEGRAPASGTAVYTLDNGLSLTYAELLEQLRVPAAASYGAWLEQLQAALDKEGAEFPNPLRALLGALRAGPPAFGSTGCTAHMEMLEARGFGSPRITAAVLRVYLDRFAQEKALPAA